MKQWKTLEDFRIDYGRPLDIFSELDYAVRAINKPIANNANGQPYGVSDALGITPADIERYWFQLYEDYLIYKPYDFLTETSAMAERLKTRMITTFRMNAPKYKALVFALTSSYDPIENYNMVEKEIGANNNATYTISEGGTENHTITGMIGSTTTQTRKVNDFVSNADDPNLNAEKTITTVEPSSKNEEMTDRTSFDNRTHKTIYEDDKSTQMGLGGQDSLTGTSTSDRVLTRSGNIGITTSQQMLESEIELRKHNLINEVFKDLKENILLAVFPQY